MPRGTVYLTNSLPWNAMEWARGFIDQLHEMDLSFLPWLVVRRRAERCGYRQLLSLASRVEYSTVSSGPRVSRR
jgi:hypothetical protein